MDDADENRQGLTLVLGADGDPLHAALSSPRAAAVQGRLDHDHLLDSADAANARLVPPVVELPGSLLGRDAQERAAAQELFAGLTAGQGMRAVRDRLVAARASAASRGASLVLGIDARRPDLRLLPWEVLASLPPEHGFAGVRIVRVLPSAEPRGLRADRSRLEVLVWAPRPDDPVAAESAEGLRELLAGEPRATVVRLPSDLATLPGPPDGDSARVLHVVAHGRDATDGVLVEAVGGDASAGGVARGLGALLATVDLVVFSVCRAASDRVEPLEAPATRVAASGVPAVIGPRASIVPAAAAAFEAGLYGGLCRGATLTDAVEEGRRRVAGLDLSHPAGRHHNHALYLADRSASARSCLAATPVQGWPAGQPNAELILHAAVALGRPAGFLGVEHVALALAEAPHAGRASRMLRGQVARIRSALDHLRPRPGETTVPPATPRLQRIGDALRPGYDVEELTRACVHSPGIRRVLGDAEVDRLLAFLALGDDTEDRGTAAIEDPVSWSGEPPPPPPAVPVVGDLRLELQGGPGDGDVLVLPADVALGRWDAGEDPPGPGRLHGPPGPESMRVSRRHARHLGGGRLQLEGSARRIRGAEIEDRRVRRRGDEGPAELVLCVGDRLLLDVTLEGDGAWLEVLPSEGTQSS